MAFSCCVHLGNRDARHSQYSNETKKNSVPLKEELTQQRANSSRASCDDAMMRTRHDARNACAVCIGICRDSRKCLCRSIFFDSCSTHCSRDESACELRNVVNGAIADSESRIFARKIFFVRTGMFARSRAPTAIVVANHRPSIRNSHSAHAYHGSALCDEGKMRTRRRRAPPERAILRARASISGDH
jgi:hypothetical protein